MNNSVTDLSRLIFFTEKGYEIPVNKTYTIEWEIIPHEQISNMFITNPKGHFMFDSSNYQDDTIPKIQIGDTSVYVYNVIDEPGKIISNEDVKIYFSNNAAVQVSGYENILLLDVSTEITNRSRNRNNPESFVEEIYNSVNLTFNTLSTSETKSIPVPLIFSNTDVTSLDVYTYSSLEQPTPDVYAYTKLTDVKLQDLSDTSLYDETYNNILEAILKSNFGDNSSVIDAFVPGIIYMGSIYQDKVSEEFVAANTIIILEKQTDGTYTRPIIHDTNQIDYDLYFEFQSDSEMKFISTDSHAVINWVDSYSTSLNSLQQKPMGYDIYIQNPNNYKGNNKSECEQYKKYIETPIFFSVGFTADVEGCYQNMMAMFIDTISENDKHERHLLGLFTFLTEVVGEDERYRALLGNLGIPDPINYTNVFKSQDPDEQGIDWQLVNIKSKELMINYDNIFPYVGTYKALAGAVKFLGYQDLIFKEWYKIKNQNGRDKFITLQTYDIQKEETLESKLKRINVTFGEFEKYKKLNRLCMIYHLNEIDDKTEETATVYDQQYPDGHYEQRYDFNVTRNIYEYRTDEILAKLFSVKDWLERHILGVNCYISDICGEYIVLERLKSPAYVTEHALQDFNTEGKFTPKIISYETFKNSSTIVHCTLSEFTNLTLEDYEYLPIETFIHDIKKYNNYTVYVSSPLQTLVPATEYQFKLTSENNTIGTLYEFTSDETKTNPILIQEDKVKFFRDTSIESIIDSNKLPIIELYKANIRTLEGNWDTNIAYSIQTETDPYSGKSFYTFTDKQNKNVLYKGLQKVILRPATSYDTSLFINDTQQETQSDENNYSMEQLYGEENIKTINSSFSYTLNTKWNIPVFKLSNYILSNENPQIGISGEFMLEILDGRLLFRNKLKNKEKSECIGAEVRFNLEASPEDVIHSTEVNYTYLSEKYPIYSYEYRLGVPARARKFDAVIERRIEASTFINDIVDIPINRLGTYLVEVNAFDQYNTIYNNMSSKRTNIYGNNIAVDMIVNTEYMSNNRQFFDKNKYGEKLSDRSVNKLLTDIHNNSSIPLQPQEYKLYDIDIDIDNPQTISYDIMSYAQEIPNEGDFILFNNFTEKVENIQFSNKLYVIKLLNENPNPDTLMNCSYIGICLYDNNSKEIIYDSSAIKSNYDYSNNSISISKDYEEIYNMFNNSENVDAYVYSKSEKILNPDTDISINYNDRLTYIKDPSKYFVKGQNIKICYSSEKEIHNLYSDNVIDNETTYRIIDVSILPDMNIYTLNGIIDLYKLDNHFYHNNAIYNSEAINSSFLQLDTNAPYMLKMCPSHLQAVQYILRVEGNTYNYIMSHNNNSLMRVNTDIAETPLLFQNHIDEIYSATIYEYDPLILKDIFSDPSILYDNKSDLYLYRDFPITVKKYQNIILRPQSNQTVLTNTRTKPMKTLWEWYTYLIDDVTNTDLRLNLTNKQLLFKSINPILSIQPELLGTQSPQMTCMDIYGNKIVNKADGFIYVNPIKEDKQTDTIAKSIYYKDVYIVGFETELINNYVMAADGETTYFTYTNNNLLGADSDDNVQHLIINYKIYYNDGTVLENTGADIKLLKPNTGTPARSNKVKIQLDESEYPHKHVNANIQTKFTINETHERDLIAPEIIKDVEVKQYGYSKTIRIYDFSFNVKNLPAEGIEELTNDILSEYITNIKYRQDRSEGETEMIIGDTLQECNLIVSGFTYIDKINGITNTIQENNMGERVIGSLELTVQFYVNGVTDVIQATGYAIIKQD